MAVERIEERNLPKYIQTIPIFFFLGFVFLPRGTACKNSLHKSRLNILILTISRWVKGLTAHRMRLLREQDLSFWEQNRSYEKSLSLQEQSPICCQRIKITNLSWAVAKRSTFSGHNFESPSRPKGSHCSLGSFQLLSAGTIPKTLAKMSNSHSQTSKYRALVLKILQFHFKNIKVSIHLLIRSYRGISISLNLFHNQLKVLCIQFELY